ncbi:hypothetical protein BIV25_01090 [Streptomyces sp. MUSC 14]|nr:hypothetical protein BIV25_01090 [Streptomyces sp. MUSC 14]
MPRQSHIHSETLHREGHAVGMHSIATLVMIVLFVAYCIFIVSALRGAVTSRLQLLAKAVWVVVIFALPFAGSLLWHLVGKKSALV